MDQNLKIEHEQRSIPFLPFGARRRLNFHRCLFNLVPIRAQSRTTTLRIAFHHRPFSIFICIAEDLLEESVKSTVAADVWVFVGCFLLLGGQNFGSDAFPVFFVFHGGGGGCGRGRLRGISECYVNVKRSKGKIEG